MSAARAHFQLSQRVSAEMPCVPELASMTPGCWLEVMTHLDPRYGGLSVTVPRLATSLRSNLGHRPFDISVAAFCTPGEEVVPEGMDAAQVSFWPAARKPWMLDRMESRELRNALVELMRGVEGVHIHGLWEQSTAVAAEMARAAKRPYILSAHGMLEPWALENKRLKKLVYSLLVERRNLARATCLHALTWAEAQHMIRFGARSPIVIVPNAVECPETASSAEFLELFPSLRGRRLILFMGRLHRKKGLDLLLEAWRAIAPRHPDAALVLAGPDSEDSQARLQTYVAANGLGESVVFPGMLSGALKWSALAASEAFTLPSFSEGLSVAILEAMGMGLPVLITHLCNMPEAARADAGWEIEPELAPLTEGLERILQNTPIENLEMGTRGAGLIRSRYVWPVVARQMAEVYRWTAGGPMPSTADIIFPA